MDFLDKRSKLRKMDMRFGTWNVRSLYRAASLVTIVKELSQCKLDLVEVQEVRWHQTSSQIYIFLGKGNENHELGTGFFVHKRVCW
jgi:exonuclease III